MSRRPWPPNPRDAKHRNFAAITHHLPVTLFLIVVSALVAVLTMAGRDSEKADALFLSSQQTSYEINLLVEEYDRITEKLRETGDAVQTVEPFSQDDEEAISNLRMEVENRIVRKTDPLVDVKKGQLWRLATPMFLHFGVIHIAFNMMWLWQFGVVLETRFRSLRFLALVLAVAVLSNLAQGFFGGTNFGGMSGVNYGLFGFLLLRSKLHPSPEFVMNPRVVALMLIWLVVCFTGSFGPVANAAHLVGFISGGAIGMINALMAGGWRILKRRARFRAAVSSSANCIHQCHRCGKTERSDANMDFYVSAIDQQEYCRDHLPEK